MNLEEHYEQLEALFDDAARNYDLTYGPPSGSRGGNPLATWLREQNLALLRSVMPEGGALLDIGCGTGEEALTLAQEGYAVLGIDISNKMIWQAQAKAAGNEIRRGLLFHKLPAGKLATLDERGPFQAASSSLGTLNTEPDLAGVAAGLHELLEPGAPFVAMVMSRHCLFEIWHNIRRFKAGETMARGGEWEPGRAGASSVTAPVRFYQPAEFATHFEPHFTVEQVMACPLWLPPLNLQKLYNEQPERFTRLEQRDRAMRTWTGFRAWGDHFLMVLRHVSG